MGNAILELKNLKKYFPTKAGLLHAVDDVSLSIDSGETLGLVGESGCGKSTIGRLAIRLLDPTEGSVFFEGTDITRLDRKSMRMMRRKMQIVFQDPYSSLDGRKSVFESIGEPLRVQKIYPSKRPGDPPGQFLPARAGWRPPPEGRHCARAGAQSVVSRAG